MPEFSDVDLLLKIIPIMGLMTLGYDSLHSVYLRFHQKGEKASTEYFTAHILLNIGTSCTRGNSGNFPPHMQNSVVFS